MKKEYEGKKIIWCHWDLIRFLKEKYLTEQEVIGVVGFEKTKDGKEIVLDYKIYMKKEEEKYKVDVFTSKTEKDEFSFESFGDLQEFVDYLPYRYPEYKERPAELVVLEDK